MKSLITTAALVAILTAAILPASAGNSWNNNWRGNCWNCGGINPGAAVALGLGSFALGALATNPGWYRPYWATPPIYYQPRWCWNGYYSYVC